MLLYVYIVIIVVIVIIVIIIVIGKDDLAHMQAQAAMPCLSNTYNNSAWIYYLWDWVRR